MMKTINGIIIGTVDEIGPVEKSMRRAWADGRSNIWPSHSDHPVLCPGEVYGIGIEPGDIHDTYYVLSSDTVLRELFSL